jgi:hypothetical protein
MKQNLINPHNLAAKCIEARYLAMNNPKEILPRNTSSNIIKEATEKYGLDKGNIKVSTLKGIFRKNRGLFVNGQGLNSPMLCVEKLVVV